MKVWKKFKKLTEAINNLRQRNCWSKCYHCKETWSDIETEHVHMIVMEEGTRYLCDGCLEILEA